MAAGDKKLILDSKYSNNQRFENKKICCTDYICYFLNELLIFH